MRRIAVLALLAAGCTNFALLAELKPRKVVVRFTDKFFQPDGGVTLVPKSKTGLAPCLMWVDIPQTKQWQKVEGTWTADGECTLRDVPPGETLLSGIPSEPNGFIAVGPEVGDFGEDFAGRPVAFGTAKTTLTVDLTGAAPLENETATAMYLPDFGMGLVNYNGATSAKVGVPMGMLGSTSFPITFDFEALPLVVAGEPIDVYQGVPFDPGQPSFTLAKRGTAQIGLLKGQNVRTSVPLTDLPSRAPGFAPFSFNPAAFYAAMEKDLPSPVLYGGAVGQNAIPVGGALALPLPVQVTFHRDGGTALTATATQVDPFPGRAWTPYIQIEGAWLSVVQPTEDTLGLILLGASYQGPADALGWVTSGWMTPPRNIQALRRDGQKVNEGTVDSLGPTLIWDEPATGFANRYLVHVYEMSVNAQDTRRLDFTKDPRFVFVDRPEAHIPPGILKPKSIYAFVVTATNCIANDPARPLKLSVLQTCAQSSSRSGLLLTPDR